MIDTLPLNSWLPPLITGAELAEILRYSGVTSAFRSWLKFAEIETVPGRKDIYDPHHVRQRLNAVQGILPHNSHTTALPHTGSETKNYTQIRREKRGKFR